MNYKLLALIVFLIIVIFMYLTLPKDVDTKNRIQGDGKVEIQKKENN